MANAIGKLISLVTIAVVFAFLIQVINCEDFILLPYEAAHCVVRS